MLSAPILVFDVENSAAVGTGNMVELPVWRVAVLLAKVVVVYAYVVFACRAVNGHADGYLVYADCYIFGFHIFFSLLVCDVGRQVFEGVSNRGDIPFFVI